MREHKFRRHIHLFTDTVFLVGNGASRKDFDLNLLKGKGTIIGCNALYRDFAPDILISHDSAMITEILKSRYPGFILTNKGHGTIKNKIVHKLANARTSGVYGLKFITSIMQPSKCYILGMDGYPGNVYKGTSNYSLPTDKFYTKVTKQYREIIESSDKEFINVNTKDSWQVSDKPNYRFISYKQFIGELAQSA